MATGPRGRVGSGLNGERHEAQSTKQVPPDDGCAARSRPCNGDGTETDAPTSTPGVPACDTTDKVDDPSVLNGVYQVDWSYEDLAEASGLPGEIVEENDGLITVSLFDGCFSTVWEEGAPCEGSYIVTGERVSFVATNRIADWGCAPEFLGLEFSNAA